MTKTQIEEGVIFELALVASAGPINPPAKIADLGLDSLEFLDLVVSLEKEFKIQIGAEEVAECETVGDLIGLIEKKCA